MIRVLLNDSLLISQKVPPLTEEESALVAIEEWPDMPATLKIEWLFENTAGNPLLLTQMLHSIRESENTSGIFKCKQDILQYRLKSIDTSAQQLLDIISLFPHHVSLNMLEQVSGHNLLDIIYTCDELQQKLILSKRIGKNGDVFVSFAHHQLKDIVYTQLSLLNKRTLHIRIAKILEKVCLPYDSGLYQQIIYHYTEGHDFLHAFVYKVQNLNVYLAMLCDNMDLEMRSNYHYGSLPTFSAEFLYQYSNDANVDNYFDELLHELKQLRGTNHQERILNHAEMVILCTKGLFYIFRGKYREGINAIQRLEKCAVQLNSTEMLTHVHRELCHYAIQTVQVALIEKHALAGIQIALEQGCRSDLAIFYRLEGLACVLGGKYAQADYYLRLSLDVLNDFSDYEHKYLSNVSCAHNYLGEMYRKSGNFPAALTEYQTAISICSGSSLRSAAMYHCNYGQALFASGRFKDALAEFQAAQAGYSSYWGITGRATTLAYLALLQSETLKLSETLNLLQEAEQFSLLTGSTIEQGIVLLIKGYMKDQLILHGRPPKDPLYEVCLPLSSEQYYLSAQILLNKTPNNYECEWIPKLQRGITFLALLGTSITKE